MIRPRSVGAASRGKAKVSSGPPSFEMAWEEEEQEGEGRSSFGEPVGSIRARAYIASVEAHLESPPNRAVASDVQGRGLTTAQRCLASHRSSLWNTSTM